MTKQSTMNFAAAIEALRPLTAPHKTDQGVRTGFLMTDATRVLGGLGYASNALAMVLLFAIVGRLVPQGNQADGLTIIIAMIVGAVGVLMIRGCFQTPATPPSKE